MGFIHLNPNAVSCLASLWTLFTWPQLVFSSLVLRNRALLTWPTAGCASITVSIGLWKTCWNIPVSRPNLRRPLHLFHDHYATVQTFSPNSYQLPSPQQQTGAPPAGLPMIIVSHYWIWTSQMFGHTVKVCSFSWSPSRPPTKRQELAVFPALHITAALLYHISLLLCQVQPHKPPPDPSSCGGSDSPILLNNAHHWTDAFNWQLEPINTEASSHGYGTIQYICAYSWMKLHFQQDSQLWKVSVSQAFGRPERPLRRLEMFGGWLTSAAAFSRPAPWVFTLRSYNFQVLDNWVDLFNIWKCFKYLNIFARHCSLNSRV